MSAIALHSYTGNVTGTVLDVSATTQVDLHMVDIQNTTAAVAYLQVFPRAAAAITLGTTVPRYAFGIPASGHITIVIPEGMRLGGDGCSVAGTTTRGGNTGAALDINLAYK
jgi:hypothetical protein